MKSCRLGSGCHFKHEKKKTNSKTDNVDETVTTLQATIAEQDKLNKQEEL